MEGAAHINENCNVCMCIFFPWLPISPYMEGDAERNENCNVCVCILFPWSPISPNMEGFAHINENCNVCMCILFLWSPISPTWLGLLREMRIAMSVCVYYSLDYLIPQTWRGCSHKWELQCVCVCYSLGHVFPQTWRGCLHKWELQCLYVYIIPLIKYFPSTEGVAERNESCNVCVCILLPWSPISPTWRGGGGVLTEMRIPMSVYVFYSFDHLFFHHGGGCWEKWVLQCMYVYIIPLIT